MRSSSLACAGRRGRETVPQEHAGEVSSVIWRHGGKAYRPVYLCVLTGGVPHHRPAAFLQQRHRR